ncbi:unnamed protein product [Heterobilharzia americana]|nr:unnamed protein product [Heterobilharzia americana]CAH8593513.1 unnamed protein product [Heterobilharzia americana]CAH8622393.1 unnamed protein product [Heterobilharzia americana]
MGGAVNGMGGNTNQNLNQRPSYVGQNQNSQTQDSASGSRNQGLGRLNQFPNGQTQGSSSQSSSQQGQNPTEYYQGQIDGRSHFYDEDDDIIRTLPPSYEDHDAPHQKSYARAYTGGCGQNPGNAEGGSYRRNEFEYTVEGWITPSSEQQYTGLLNKRLMKRRSYTYPRPSQSQTNGEYYNPVGSKPGVFMGGSNQVLTGVVKRHLH